MIRGSRIPDRNSMVLAEGSNAQKPGFAKLPTVVGLQNMNGHERTLALNAAKVLWEPIPDHDDWRRIRRGGWPATVSCDCTVLPRLVWLKDSQVKFTSG